MTTHLILHLNNPSPPPTPTLNPDESKLDDSPSFTAYTSTLDEQTIQSQKTQTLVKSNGGLLMSFTLHIYNINTYDPLSLAFVTPHIHRNGQVVIHIHNDNPTTTPNENNKEHDGWKQIMSKMQRSIILAGLQTASERKISATCRILTMTKMKSSGSNGSGSGGTAKLSFGKPAPLQFHKSKTSSSSKISTKTIKINIGNLDDDLSNDDDFINEDDLLQSNLVAPPQQLSKLELTARQKKLDDCGGRKACDNCSCGRKEMEEMVNSEAGEMKQENVVVPSSSCGNCSKGDAFRCAGCPFLGKPAFKEGEERLVLDLD